MITTIVNKKDYIKCNYLRLFLAITCLFFISNISLGATYYWVGGTSGNWNAQSSWSNSLGGSAIGAGTVTFTATDIVYLDGSDISSTVGLQTGTITANFTASSSVGKVNLLNSATAIFLQTGASPWTLTIGSTASDGTDFSIASGSTLSITGTSGTNLMTVTQNNNANCPAQIDGYIKVNDYGVLTKAANPSFTFTSGSTYEHARDGGTVVTATWNTGSATKITGYVSTALAGLGQTFYNMEWNCTTQTAAANLSANITISNLFTLTSTGSGSVVINNTNSSTRTIATKDFTQTGGTLDLSADGNSTSIGILSVSGTFNQTAGTIIKTAGSTGTTSALASKLLFNGTANQSATFASATGIGAGTNVEINNTGTAPTNVVTLQNAVTLPATNLFLTAGEFNLGSSTLTLGSGLTIQRTAGTLLKASGAFSYTSTINVTYLTNSLTTGDELPTLSSALNNLTISPSSGNTVTLGANVQVNGNFSQTAGTFVVGGNLDVYGSLGVTGTFTIGNSTTARAIILRGAVTIAAASTMNVGAFNATHTLDIRGALTNNGTINMYNAAGRVCDVTFSTVNQTLIGTNTFTGITVPDGLTIIQNGTITINGNLTVGQGTSGIFTIGNNTTARTLSVTGNILVNSGANFNVGAFAATHLVNLTGNLTNNGTFSLYTASGQVANITLNGASSVISGSGTPVFSNLTVTPGVGNTATLGVNATVNGDLSISTGTFDLSTFTANRQAAGGTITVSSGASLKIGGTNTFPSNYSTVTITGSTIEYSGTAQSVRALTYNNLTISGGNTKTLAASTTVNGILNLNSGVLSLGVSNYTLTLGSSATITGSFSSTNMIQSSGTGSVIKQFSATGAFTYPIGTTTLYTPATVNISTATISPSPATLSIRAVATIAPSQLDASYSLSKHWITTSANMSGVNATLTFGYDNSEANTTVEPDYVSGYYTSSWTAGTTSDVDESANTISFTRTGVANLTGNWTAGPSQAFSAVTFYSRATGNWEDANTWSTVALGGTASTTYPTASANVIIGNSNVVTITAGAKTMTSVQIDATGILDIGTYTGLTFTTFNGSGTLRISAAAAGTAVFPTVTTNNFISTTGNTVEYNGSTSYTLPATTTYQNLVFSGGGNKTSTAILTINAAATVKDNTTWTQAATVTVNGNLTVGEGASGTFTIGNSTTARTLSVNGNILINNGGTFNVGAFAAIHVLTLTGNLTNNGTFSLYNTSAQVGNLTFNGSSASSLISGSGTLTFNSLTVNNTNTVTAGANLDIYGTLTVGNGVSGTLTIGNSTTNRSIIARGAITLNTGSTLNVGAFNATHSLEIRGALTNSGTLNMYNAAGQVCNVTFTTTTQTIAGTCTYNAMTVGDGVTASINANVSFYGDVTVGQGSSGVLNIGNGTTIRTINFLGNIINNVGATLQANNAAAIHIVNISGNITNYSSNIINFYRTPSQLANVTFHGNTTISGNQVTFNNVTINAGNSLTIAPGTQINITSGASITNNGTFYVVGTSTSNRAVVSRSGASSGYTIVQSNSGATFHAKFYKFEYLNGNGISISDGSIDATNNFSDGIFTLGTGSQYLTLTGYNIASAINIDRVTFDVGPAKNIVRATGASAGAITFRYAAGALAGAAYETDADGKINWASMAGLYSRGSSTWSNNSNWSTSNGGASCSCLPGTTDNVYIKDGHTVTIDQNVSVKSITIGEGNSGILTIGNNTTNRTIATTDFVEVSSGATFNVGNFDAQHTLSIGYNLVNNGVFNMYNNTFRVANVTFTTNVAKQITGNSPIFNHLIFAASSNTTTAGVALDIRGDVTLNTAATFDLGAFTHSVKGSWNDNSTGTVSGASGTIEFTGNSSTINNASEFTNISFNGTSGGNHTLTGAITVSGNLQAINNAQIIASGNVTHTLSGTFTINSGSVYNQSVGTMTFNGLKRSIDVSNATFYNITFNPTTSSDTITVSGNIVTNTNGALTINDGKVVTSNGNHTLRGNFNINGSAIANFSGQIIMTGGTITESANADNDITLGTASLDAQGNVWIGANKSVKVNNNVTVTSGYIVVDNGSTLQCLTSGKTLTVSNVGTLYVRGTNNFPTGFDTYTLQPTSVTRYDQNINQTIRGNITYGHLQTTGVASNCTKTVDGPLIVKGYIDFNGAGITALRLLNYAHTIGGDITNASNDTLVSTTGGSVTFDNANANQTLNTGNYTFYDLAFTLDNPTTNRTKTIGANITVNNNFSVSTLSASFINIISIGNFQINNGGTGAFSLGANCQLNTSGTNQFLNSVRSFASATFAPTSTTLYNGSAYQQIAAKTAAGATGIVYGHLSFAGSSRKALAANVEAVGNISVAGNTPVLADSTFTLKVGGSWGLGTANYTITTSGTYTSNSATGKIIFNGADQTINSSNFNKVFFAGTGTKLFSGNLIVRDSLRINNGATVDANIRNINIAGDWYAESAGTFNQTTGVTTFDGLVNNQTVSSSPSSYFGNFAINKQGSNKTLTAVSDLDINGYVNFLNFSDPDGGGPQCPELGAATFDITGRTINVGSHWYYRRLTNFISANSTVIFDGDLAQYIYNGNGNGGTTFYNIKFTGQGIKTFENGGGVASTTPATTSCGYYNTYNIDGNFEINNCTVNAQNLPMTVAGNWINNGTFQHSNTITFDGANQNLTASSFNTVIFAGTGIKQLDGNISLNGNLTISDGITLDVSVSNNTISVGGNWTNTGTGIFKAQQGSVIFTGGNKTIATGGATIDKRFHNIEVNQSASANSSSLSGAILVNNDFTVTVGQFVTGANNVSVRGNFINNDIFNQSSNSSVLTFNDSTSTSRIIDPGTVAGTTYRSTIINAPGTTYTLQNSYPIVGDQPLVMNGGTLKLNSKTLSLLNAALTINTGATLEVNQGASLTLGNSNTTAVINIAGGTLKAVGTSAESANLGRTSGTGGYTINQTAGTFHAKYYTINNTVGTGITFNGGTIDATNNFSEGSFSNGASGASTQYLNFASTFTLTGDTVKNVVFNTGPAFNVKRNTSTPGQIVFEFATGALAGQTFESDPTTSASNATGNIDWTYPNAAFWDAGGGVDNSWHTAANWTGDVVPDATRKVILDHTYVAGAYTVVINAANAQVQNLTVDRGSSANAITLQLNNGFDLDVDKNISVLAGCTFTVLHTTSTINVGGNWSVSGTFTHGSSTVTFDGVADYFTIASGTSSFYNFVLDGANSVYTLGSAITVANDLTIADGRLDVSNSNLGVTLGGNWSNVSLGAKVALFTARTGTLTLNKTTGTQTITGTGPFYNITTSGTTAATKQFLSSTTLNGSLTIGANSIVDAGTNNLFVYVNWTNNANASAFTQTGTASVFFSGVNQTIGGTSKTTFNDLNFAGTGTKTLAIDLDVNSSFTVASTVGIVNLQTYQVTGLGATNLLDVTGTTRLDVRGANNFPSGFETISLATSSTVYYVSTNIVNQSIANTTYGNLSLANLTGSGLTTKTVSSNLIVQGSLNVGDIYTSLNVNNNIITLTGNLGFPTGSSNPILWGTNGGAGTLIHVGGDWNLDADITQYNNLTLAGSGWKQLNTNISITGDLEVQSGIRFIMNAFTTTGTVTKSLTMASGARLDCSILSPQIAFPTAFTNYNIDASSLVVLDGNDPQIISSAPSYGNVILTNGDSTVLNGNLTVNGYLETRADTLVDAGYNITLNGAYAEINNYVATGSSKFTLGGATQSVYDNSYYNSDNILSFKKITFSNSGTKTFGDGNDAISITDSLLVTGNGTLIVNSSRNIDFKGSSWKNLRTFNITGGTLTFSGTVAQTVQAGPTNSFNNIQISNISAPVTLVTNSADINGNLTIDASATFDMGSLTHTVASSIISNSGTWTTTNTNLTFDRNGNQTIPALVARNVITATGGTKIMDGIWTVKDLTINSGTALNSSASAYNITVQGNWSNSGTFTHNGNKVIFAGTSTPLTITGNGSNFYDVDFTPSSSATYNLMSASTRIARTMNLGVNAVLNLNAKTLILGSNIGSGKNYDIKGTLHVNSNAVLQFNNQGSQCIMDVNGASGILKVVGSSNNIAAISREVAGVAGAETQINITTGAIHANYYSIEFLSDAGMNVQATGTVDVVNNFSNGTWSNLRTATGTTKRYLTLDAPVTDSIRGVVFNFTGTPTVGTHFNVTRNTGSAITFAAPISGALQGEVYESDPTGPIPNGSGKINWPAVSLLTWTGAASQNWHNAANWLPNIVPDSTYDVTIPNVANDPIILNDDASCRLMTITNGILSIQGARDLTVKSDITIGTGNNAGRLIVENNTNVITVGGSWTRGTNGVFNNGSSTVIFNAVSGTSTISNGLPTLYKFYNITFNGDALFDLVGATIDIDGDLTITNGTVEPSTANYNLTLGGNFNNNNGVFSTSTAGTVTLDGAAQNIVYGNFYNLAVAGTGTKSAANSMAIVNTLTVSSPSTLASTGGSFDLNGNVTINSGATFNDGGQAHTFSGSIWAGTGSYTGVGTVTFDRAGQQTINASTFNNLILDGNNAKIIAGNVVINGDMTVKNTTSYLNLQTFNVTNSTAGAFGTFTLEDNGIIYARGTNNFPSGFANYSVGANSTVNFDALFSQQILGGVPYGNLNIAPNTGAVGFTRTLTDNIIVQGSLNFGISTLDVSATNYKVTVGGNWNNNSNGSFIARNGEVVFNGSSSTTQYINIGNIGATGTKSFYDVSIANTGGATVIFNNTIEPVISNNLLVSNGILNNNGRNVSVGGDFRAFNSGSFATVGTYILNKASGTSVIQTNGSTLQNLTVNAPGTTYNVQDNLTLNGNFTLTAGIFNGNGKNVILGDYVPSRTAAIAGTYKVGPGGTLALGANLNVSTTGTMEVVGTKTNIATVTYRSAATGRYNFLVDGTIKAQYYLFQNMSTAGIYVSSSATIDPTYKLCDGTFTNGASGGTLLKIDNAQTLSIDSVSFPTNQGGAGRSNVTKLANTGRITFVESNGVFSGSGFENDPNSRLDWINSSVLTWIGTINDDWYNLSNWSPSVGLQRVPLASDNVVIAAAANKPAIKLDGAVCKDLTVNNGAFLTMNTTAGAAVDFDVKGNIVLNGFFEMKTANDSLVVARDWSRSTTGTFKPGYGTVIFHGLGGLNNINNSTSDFYNVVVQGSGANYQLGANSSVLNNLTVTATFDANNYNLTVGGNWNTAAGSFIPGTGTVRLNGTSSTKTINTASAFNHLTISGGSNNFQLSSNISTNGNLNIDNAILLLNSRTLNVGDGSGADALNIGSAGTVDIRGNESLRLGSNASVNVSSGGIIKIVGTNATNTANVTRQSTGNYSFVVNNGGKIHAKYYKFDYINASGVTVLAGALMDPVNNFSEGAFSNGVAGGRYLFLQNEISAAVGFAGDTTLATNVVFNSGPSKNVKRTSGTGYIKFSDSDGVRGGFIFEDDDNTAASGKVRWKYTSPTFFWTGNTSTSWNDPANWDDGGGSGGIPTATTNVFIVDVTTTTNRFPVLNATADGVAKSVKIYESASLVIGGNYNLVSAGSVDISGRLQVSTGSTSNISVGGQWSVDVSTAGQFIHGGASTVTFNSPLSTNKAITPGSSPFNNLVINGSGAYQTQSSIDVDGNLTITAGTLQVTNSAHQVNVGGTWTNNGTFTSNSGAAAVIFDGSSQTITSASGETFNNLTLSGTGTKTLGSNISIVGNLNISSGVTLNGSSRTINLTGNWVSNGSAFSAGTSTVNLSGTAVQQIGRANVTGETFYNLVINNTSPVAPQIDVTSDINIATGGSITFTRGILESTSADMVTFNNNASAIGGSNSTHISGPVTKVGTSDFIFPTGKGGKWARISIDNVSTSSTFVAEYFIGQYSNMSVYAAQLDHVSYMEYWNLSRISGTGTAYVKLYWEDAGASKINSVTVQDLVVAHFDGIHWESKGHSTITGGIGNGVAGTIRSSAALASFSPITLGSEYGNNALPIELLDFKATLAGKEVQLAWSTATEVNNSFFTVEKSNYGIKFTPVLTVKGAGNSRELKSYTAVDKNPLPEISYYRLKQTDINGESSFSESVAVFNSSVVDFIISPNPNEGHDIELFLQGVDNKTLLHVKVYDINEKLYLSKKLIPNENLIIQLGEDFKLRRGVYIVSIRIGAATIAKKMIVK